MSRYLLHIFTLLLSVVSFTGCHNDDLPSFSHNGLQPNQQECIVVLGDVQCYTAGSRQVKPLHRSLTWLLTDTIRPLFFSCVLQVGDVTNGNKDNQWGHFKKAIAPLLEAGIPVYSCTGNHDYFWDSNFKITNRNSSKINRYLSHCFQEKDIRARFEDDKVENMIVHLPLERVDFDLILLEFAPREEVLDWACRWVDEHSEQQFILMTHEMLTHAGALISTDSYAEKHFDGTSSTWVTPADIMQRLLRPHPNVILTLSGHNGFTAINDRELNVAGRPVPIVQFNLQYQPNGGDSMLLLLKINELTGIISCEVVHTDTDTTVDTELTGYEISIPATR